MLLNFILKNWTNIFTKVKVLRKIVHSQIFFLNSEILAPEIELVTVEN